MAAVPDLKVNENALYWNPAEVTVPTPPEVEAGGDPMSQMLSAVMPNIADDVAKKVAETRTREELFEDNLLAAKNAYRNMDGAAEQDLQAAGHAVESGGAGAGGTAGAGSAGGQMGQFGQLLGLPMQMAGAAAAVPQGAMEAVQGAGEKVSQLASTIGENLAGGGDAELAADTDPNAGSTGDLLDQQVEASAENGSEADAPEDEPEPESSRKSDDRINAAGDSSSEISL